MSSIKFGTYTPPEEEKKENKIDVIVSVFFDGTLNNKANTTSRINDDNKYTWLFTKGDTSYENDYSNIARLEMNYNAQVKPQETNNENKIITYETRNINVYVEGIGTMDGGDDLDAKYGTVTGMGRHGAKAKAEKSFKLILKKLNKINLNEGTIINKISIDAYGFSRGAAAARHFLNSCSGRKKATLERNYKEENGQKVYTDEENGWFDGISTEEYQEYTYGGDLGVYLKEKGVKFSKVELRFAGLFDTVPSIGVFSHENDHKQLNLSLPSKLKKAVHITATDEHRKNFELRQISGASLTSSKRVEINLPGVHSDIGGGYNDAKKEKIRLSSSRSKAIILEDKKWLISQGWYTKNDLKITEIDTSYESESLGKVEQKNYTLHGYKASISNKYSFIPLHLMKDYAEKIHKNLFKPKINTSFKISGNTLSAANERINDYIKQRDEIPHDLTSSEVTQKDISLIKKLRYHHFHFSASLDIGMAPEGYANNRKRTIY